MIRVIPQSAFSPQLVVARKARYAGSQEIKTPSLRAEGEAIQNIYYKTMDCHVATLLAMTILLDTA